MSCDLLVLEVIDWSSVVGVISRSFALERKKPVIFELYNIFSDSLGLA